MSILLNFDTTRRYQAVLERIGCWDGRFGDASSEIVFGNYEPYGPAKSNPPAARGCELKSDFNIFI